MLTIHVGLQKTGSTTLQKTLARIPRRSLDNIIYVGKESCLHNEGFNGFRSDAKRFVVPQNFHSTYTVKQLKRGKSLILSDEAFLGVPLSSRNRHMYLDAIESAATMNKVFGEITDFQIVIYVRPQNIWIESLYAQYAKARTSDRALHAEAFATTLIESRYFHWSNLINDLYNQIGSHRVVVRPYLNNTKITSDFLNVLGLKNDKLLINEAIYNKRLHAKQIASLQRFTMLLRDNGAEHLIPYVRENLFQDNFDEPMLEFSYFSEETQIKVLDIVKSDWERLASITSKADPKTSQLFLAEAENAHIQKTIPFLGPLDQIPITNTILKALQVEMTKSITRSCLESYFFYRATSYLNTIYICKDVDILIHKLKKIFLSKLPTRSNFST